MLAAGHGDAGHMVQPHFAAEVVGEGHDVARAFVVDAVGHRIVHRHVVHRRQMKHVVDLAGDLLEVGGANQTRLGDVARDRHQAPCMIAVAQRLLGELVLRSFADQHINLAVLALEQLLQQEFADEAGGAGDEVIHDVLLSLYFDAAPGSPDPG